MNSKITVTVASVRKEKKHIFTKRVLLLMMKKITMAPQMKKGTDLLPKNYSTLFRPVSLFFAKLLNLT